MGFIYLITNKINNKKYVGQTKYTIEHRIKSHLDNIERGNPSNSLIDNAIKKYGIENFIIEKLEECSNDLLDEREIFWIENKNSYVRNNEGYNLTLGGKGKLEYSDEDILQLWNKGLKNEEIAKKLFANPNTISQRLKVLLPEGEVRKRHLESNKKKVAQFDLEGNLIKIWNSAAEAEEELKLSKGSVCRCCKNQRTHVDKSIWTYYEEMESIKNRVIEYAKSVKCMDVIMIDDNGKELAYFSSGKQAEIELNLPRGKVSEVCWHKYGRKSVCGLKFEWAHKEKRRMANEGK